jgi:PKD repeat protein
VGEDSTLVSVLEPYDMYEWSPMGETGQSIWTVAGNYTVNVTDADGCVDSAMVNVIQVDNPVEPVITIAGDLEFCEGGSAVLSGPPGFPQYAWNTGSTTQDITVFESGIYTLYVTDSIGCSSAISSIEIIVNPVPVASFSYTLTDFTVDLTNLTLNATDYSWIAELEIPDSIPPAVIVGTSIAADTAFTFAVGGVYTITLFAENECGSDSTSVTLGIMNIGVQEASGIEGFNMYPNPAHNRLVMDMSLNENRKIDIQFFDQLGQIVLNQRNDLKVGANTINFDLSSLAQGVYSIRIADDQYTQVVKLVKR